MTDLDASIFVKDLSGYATDWWASALMALRAADPPPPPAAAVRPRNLEEVVGAMAWASDRQMPVVAWGGGSGVCGAAQPGEKALVVDLREMSAVDVDPGSMTVKAEAGAYGPSVEEALGAHGLTLGHFPQSFELSTVGGWIATKAAGQASTKYGGIEERVLGLTAVLPDGWVVGSAAIPRRSAGPDWWRIFLGSEGTLGIVTQAVLSAEPRPEEERWTGFLPGTFEEGLEIMRTVMLSGARPAVARVYDEADAAVNFGAAGHENGPLAVLSFEGARPIVDAEEAVFRGIVRDQGREVSRGAYGMDWKSHRFEGARIYRSILEGRGFTGPHGFVDTMELAAFWPRLPRLYHDVAEALGRHCGMVLAHASHFYTTGAAVYFTFLASCESEEEAASRYAEAWHDGMTAALNSGATISHHHGVGALKRPWTAEEWGSGIEALARIKRAFDPEGRMNPGKLYPPS